MGIKDWLELDKAEKIGSFDVILDTIKCISDKEMRVLIDWFINTLTVDEQLKVIDRQGKKESYLEQLDYFLEHVLMAIVNGLDEMIGVKI